MKILLLGLTALILSTEPKPQINSSNIPVGLKSLMNDCQSGDLFSGTLLVAKDGEIIFEESYGYSDKGKNILNSSATMYNIGSIGKEFTAVLILQLTQEGKLDLDNNITKYLPQIPESASSKVTVRQLLNHTSGFGDYLMNPDFRSNKDKYKNLSDLIELISKEELEFDPGSNKRYSNSGYALLGGIIEKITGESFESNLKEKILSPLEMNSTAYPDWDDNNPLKAIGYTKDIKGGLHDNKNLRLHPTPAGGMYSTARDLLKFDHSLMNDERLLNENSKMLLFSHFEKQTNLTLAKMKSDENASIAFAGGAPGINALYLLFPGSGYTAIILSNYDQAAENIEPQIVSIINGKKYEKPKLPVSQFLYKVYLEHGPEKFAEVMRETLQSHGYALMDDAILNHTGYQFLAEELNNAAISIFKLNAELFPEIANCYDSLGEAYLKSGNKMEAKSCYMKALELDPQNENVKRILEQLN